MLIQIVNSLCIYFFKLDFKFFYQVAIKKFYLFLDVTSIPIHHDTGTITPEDITAAIKPNTCLITVMMANNETGVIMVS